ncbi:phospholipase-like protein [Tanacetum coccineum]|uniref:Phospholipase-like protein n=1 Tax=Tanacetum coccineum TaxID=301880 RepID=A0ABQ4Y4L8_9ASTR
MDDYLIEEELKIGFESENVRVGKYEKNIIEEQRFRVNEAKRMNILGKLTHTKENHVDSMHGKTKATISNDLSQNERVKCSFHGAMITLQVRISGNFWLTLVCLDPTRKGWLSEEHIDLWVDYMWHGRPDNANWAMVSCYFVQILLQNSTPLFYANGDKYATPWSDVDQVFFPINETAQHWCLAHFDILSGLVTFYDSGDTYDYESRDLYVRVRECLQERLPGILGATKVFEKKGIDPTDYSIRFKLADPVPKQGGIFGDCGVWVCIFLYRLAHGISLDVEDPIDVALAYREKIVRFYFSHKIDTF